MYGIHDARLTPAQQMTIRGAQVGRAGGRLPVVQVDNIGRVAETGQRLEHAATKQKEAQLLVSLVQAEIDLLMATKELTVVEKIDDDRRTGERRLPDEHRSIRAAKWKHQNDAARFEFPT